MASGSSGSSGAMWATNLKIGFIVVLTLALYTAVANMIPQVQSEVPVALSFAANVSDAAHSSVITFENLGVVLI